MAALTDPNQIEEFRLRTILKGLELELLGMSHSGHLAVLAAKRELTQNGRTWINSVKFIEEDFRALLREEKGIDV